MRISDQIAALTKVLDEDFDGIEECQSAGEVAACILLAQKARIEELEAGDCVPQVPVVPCTECQSYLRGFCQNPEVFASVKRGYQVPDGHGCPMGTVNRDT